MICLDFDTALWLWLVLDGSCHFRMVFATLAWIWQVLRALDGSVRCWMVLAFDIL